jgi:DNA-binding Lrp family transcriptional regulator
MSVTAYIFIEATQGKALEVADAVGKLRGVKSSHAVTGPVDVIALVEAPDINRLGEFTVNQIQAIPGVLRTTTNICLERPAT